MIATASAVLHSHGARSAAFSKREHKTHDEMAYTHSRWEAAAAGAYAEDEDSPPHSAPQLSSSSRESAYVA